jgi:hypothetical protein
MKKSKWLKWKIGFVGVLGLSILFHEVKISAAFEKAFTNAANDQTTDTSKLQDPVMDDFTSSVNQQNNQFDSQAGQSNQTDRSTVPSDRKSQTKTGRS